MDVIQYLDGSELLSLNVNFAQSEAYPKKDNAIITLRFKSGAIAKSYIHLWIKEYPKEQLRVFSMGGFLK